MRNLNRMKFTKLLIICIIVLGCKSVNPTKSIRKKFRDLESYKQIVNYILVNNIHKNFKTTLDFSSSNTHDSLIYRFIKEKHLLLIRTQSDSVILFIDYFMPIIGKRRELIFYFQDHYELNSFKGNGQTLIKLDSNICYIKY